MIFIIKIRKSICALCLFSLLISLPTFAFDPGAAFEKKCSSCHTIGEGEDVGPDLKGVTKRRERKWLIRFIKESQSVIEEGDPVAVEMFNKYKQKKMPDQEFSDEEIEQILKLIESGKSGMKKKTFKSALKATKFDVDNGRKLFSGELEFSKGGVSCISCHSAGNLGLLGGGKLGPNLTHAYSSYNDKGLSKVITNISFPSMSEVYKGKALTETEVFQLKAFLYEQDKKGDEDKGFTKKFILIGLLGFLLLLGFFDLLWKGRRKKTRRPNQD